MVAWPISSLTSFRFRYTFFSCIGIRSAMEFGWLVGIAKIAGVFLRGFAMILV
jgi:hypothetical protein